ncbi:hypothetical protein [Spelaeicoccus albus]|uniref:Putative membrane protein n=1 Tax=Spelaeicoccus albus TaxID=1280376 RepID=A0A7Z0A8C6_9MICO|nr:hypothetical protein [Spelaeicoccus albus]NYI66292.1 putative membrane protein [Spelaeicoccus albus]
MPYSVADYYRLNFRDRQAVKFAVDRGQRLDDPNLRPIAVATATGFLERGGVRVLKWPPVVVGVIIAAVILIWIGLWWLLLVALTVGIIGVIATERQARRLRPEWRESVAANQGTSRP